MSAIPSNKIPVVMASDGELEIDYEALSHATGKGVKLTDCPNHKIVVKTLNTIYTFVTRDGKVFGIATKEDGTLPRYLLNGSEVTIFGSTWGGSMLKNDFIGEGMCVVFSYGDRPYIRTSRIQSVTVTVASESDYSAMLG